jgi:hypothetical protein
MFTNQYIVTERSAEPQCELPDFVTVDFGDLRVRAHAKLKVTTADGEAAQVALLGYIVDPDRPDDDDETIVRRLAATAATPAKLHEDIEGTTGRYVLLFRTATATVVTGDAFHFRHIYHAVPDHETVVTSSPKLFLSFFGYELRMNDDKRALLALPEYDHHEGHWYGAEGMDDRLLKLLPNHVLDLVTRKVERVAFRPLERTEDEAKAIARASATLRGTYDALARRYRLIQPLTAGWDSRLLLAASREHSGRIDYFVFDRSSGRHDDVRVPAALAERLGLRFAAIEPEPPDEEFLALYRAEHVMPRVLPKTANISHHYLQGYDATVVNVNGNGGEVARCRYGWGGRPPSLDLVCECTPYGSKSPYVNRQMARWYEEALACETELGLRVLDLFLWEQRMGHWGAQYPFEQDIAVEEMSPFNNRGLMLGLLSVDGRERKAPPYTFYRRLIADLWPDVMAEPINPGEAWVKAMVYGNATSRYWMSKADRRGLLRFVR